MTRGSLLLVVFLALSGMGFSASARTWHVTADGSGDAPTIQAAADSSVSGDVILVGPGTHVVQVGADMKAGTSLISEDGPLATILVRGSDAGQAGIVTAAANCVIRGFTIHRVIEAPVWVVGEGTEVSDNIIETSPYGAITLYYVATTGAMTTIHHNLLYGELTGIYDATGGTPYTLVYNNIIHGGIVATGTLNPTTYCNDAVNSTDGFLGVGDFSADPMFCGVDNYYLQSDSPCAPGNHPNGVNQCGLIGPLPVGCGDVATQQRSWGAVKAMYRE